MSKIIPCVVENGLNTCYIDSLLFGLFYNQSYIDELLNTDPQESSSIFLQDLIKMKFVEPLRRHYLISNDVMNEIRNYANVCGWCKTDEYIDEQQDVSEFYSFILEQFSGKYLEFEKIAVSDSTESKLQLEKLPFIPLHPDPKKDTANVRDLLIKWIDNNIIEINDKAVTYCYKLVNTPSFIILHTNRFGSEGKIKTKIDIMKRIKFFNISDKSQSNIKWKISSIICHNGDTIKSGHYYSFTLTPDGRWLMFDDKEIPSIKQVDLQLESIQNKIMSECVFLIYLLDE